MNTITPTQEPTTNNQSRFAAFEAPNNILRRITARVSNDLTCAAEGHENHANFDSHNDHQNHQSS